MNENRKKSIEAADLCMVYNEVKDLGKYTEFLLCNSYPD